MTFEKAWYAVMQAAQELDPENPHEIILRLVPNADETSIWMTEHKFTAERGGSTLLGIAIGLVMAEDPVALATLEDIKTKGEEE
jgi:hypothetical protein